MLEDTIKPYLSSIIMANMSNMDELGTAVRCQSVYIVNCKCIGTMPLLWEHISDIVAKQIQYSVIESRKVKRLLCVLTKGDVVQDSPC